jgi:long-chain fatty acid transport protein
MQPVAGWHRRCLAFGMTSIRIKPAAKKCPAIGQTVSNWWRILAVNQSETTIMKTKLGTKKIMDTSRQLASSSAWLATLLFLAINFKISAVGFRLPNQDPEAIARGDAFAATADNPSAIYYNPAGITQLEGQNLRVGIYAVSPGLDYKSPSGVTARANSDFQPVPQIYYTYAFTNMPISVGFGMYSPYGLSLNWGDNTPFKTLAESGKLEYLSFNPVVAWKIHRTLSIAVGPTIDYSQASFKRAIGFSTGDQFRMSGDGATFGLNAGILWQPHQMWSFGVNYRSPTTIDYRGTSEAYPYFPKTSSSAAITFPQYVVAGISFRPTTNWNFEFDLDWTDWNSVKQIVFKDTSFGDVPLTLDYRSSFIYEFGVTRQLGRGYFASVGYIYAENASPDQNFTPLIPDANLSLGSIGFGHHGHRWDWAIAYHFGYNGGRTLNNPSTSQDYAANGTYKTFNNAVNVAATLKF